MASLWGDSREVKYFGGYKGFTIMSNFNGSFGEVPKLYVRGTHTYEAYLNPENPLGTIASIEATLRRLDRFAEEEQAEIERKEKALADYKEQIGRPFEHEETLRELCVRQQEMNKKLE